MRTSSSSFASGYSYAVLCDISFKWMEISDDSDDEDLVLKGLDQMVCKKMDY